MSAHKPERSRVKLLVRSAAMGSCADNCSGHGECFNGTCFCEIQFVGDECRNTNTSYFAVFATVFFLVAAVCLVQLIMSIVAEWQRCLRLKTPSVARACRITTQKLLYFVVFLASAIRGAYFTSPELFDDGWSHGIMSAYYPLLLSGSSLIVCFWAEVFHLEGVRWKQRQFLSKSFLAFVAFNVISYSLLLAELTAVRLFSSSPELRGFYLLIFNSCYAFLLFVVVVFFLIYGVEVFFKVRGGFLKDDSSYAGRSDETRQLFGDGQVGLRNKSVDVSQLHQSRLGLLSHAFMMFAIVLCLSSEILGEYLQIKVPVTKKNILTLIFRVVETGVAIWFPCCLWNSVSPEQLWILNPNKLIKSREPEVTSPRHDSSRRLSPETSSLRGGEECWICYDAQRTDAGEMIQPCRCKGDVRTVHHDCLLNWLVEKPGRKECRVCATEYRLSKGANFLSPGRLASAQDWRQVCLLLFLMSSSLLMACLTVRMVRNTLARSVAVGVALLVLYVCTKVLCQKQLEAYQKAKVSSLRIESNLPTICDSVQPGTSIAVL